MKSFNELIDELSELCKIVSEYWDIFGVKHIIPRETKEAVLRAMNIKIDSVEDITRAIGDRKSKPWKNVIEPVYIVSVDDQPVRIPVYLPVKEGDESHLTIYWTIEDESGEKAEFILMGEAINIAEIRWIDQVRYVKIDLPDLAYRDIGYYNFNLECKHLENIFPDACNILRRKSKIIIAPDTCYIPPELQDNNVWGLSVNLYAIRSQRNWGIGDFTDLFKLADWVFRLKGSFAGINPLHALPNTVPYGISPYSPISRLYKNFIYLDMEKIPEVQQLKDAGLIETDRLTEELYVFRKSEFIEYEKIANLKGEILKKAFDIFYDRNYRRNTSRSREFKKFVSEEGRSLEDFATYMALAEKHGGVNNWTEWPEKYRDVSGKDIKTFKKKQKKEILFYQYIQWLIDRQLREIAGEVEKLGMKPGLYHDLAIGSPASGSDAWSNRGVIALDADVGAPPDDFNPGGQNWGFPAIIPEKLRESAYELFIETMRKNMKYFGALRIDHALGLFRLFWIPRGMSPGEGTYVAYPAEDLLRIIALESHRNKTMVIAEDLGTIGENVRETLRSFQMLSYRLFYFERNYPDPSFLMPSEYPDMALCAVTTHDLPTLSGYWAARDLHVKKRLGQYPDDAFWRKSIEERDRDKRLMLSALRSQNLLSGDLHIDELTIPEMTFDLRLAIYRYLASTPCKLLLVNLDDIIGTLDQQNMPGTVDSYPSWRQKIPTPLEDMMSEDRFMLLSDSLSMRARPTESC
ncbi:MAG: 4-alpha-glucanotransferase [Nitrospirota bacterium]